MINHVPGAAHRPIRRFFGEQTAAVLNPEEPTTPPDLGQVPEALTAFSKQLKAAYYSAGSMAYESLRSSKLYSDFRNVTAQLAVFSPASLGSRSSRLAFWINLYNLLIIDAAISFRIERSTRERRGFFSQAAYTIGGLRYSANDIEHGILRANASRPHFPRKQFRRGDPRLALAFDQVDPRIHFALNCAARSCPPIAVYTPDRIDAELNQAAWVFVNGGGIEVEPDANTISLSMIFKWYQRDFSGGQAGRRGLRRMLAYAAPFVEDPLHREMLLQEHPVPRITYQPYDWSINK